MAISSKTKLELLKALIKAKDAFGTISDSPGLMGFLGSIWDLDVMPSEDSRYKSARGDIMQHIVNNDDWDYEYLFITRLGILNDDEKYHALLNQIVSPVFRMDKDDIEKFVLLIESYVEKDGYVMAVESIQEDSGLPIYSLILSSSRDFHPIDIPRNGIPFFVDNKLDGNPRNRWSHRISVTYPCFVLVFNGTWNDFGYKSGFFCFYYSEPNKPVEIGYTKILYHDEGIKSVADALPTDFMELGHGYCSIGQEADYYQDMKKHLGNKFESVLYALRDIAFFPEFGEPLEKNGNYRTSLLREDSAERMLRTIKYTILGYDLSSLFSFRYSFKPLYASDPVDVDFSFDNQVADPNRIFGLIGKNGSGKTQLITSLPFDISKKNDSKFQPRAPLFSKVIAVSYSVFDHFPIPKKTSTFNYVYCGIRKDEDDAYSEKGRSARFLHTVKRVTDLKRIKEWRKILLSFLDKDVVSQFITAANGLEKEFNLAGYNSIKNTLSSGQSITLHIVTEIVANIRFDSLLLFDEPETHLHPNAITEMMNTIYELVTEFESYCIIATHSPLVIRELFARNVYVLEKHESMVSVRKTGFETFGENLSVITDKVFGNRESSKQHETIVRELVNEGLTYDQIIDRLQDTNVPLGINIRLLIKSLIPS